MLNTKSLLGACAALALTVIPLWAATQPPGTAAGTPPAAAGARVAPPHEQRDPGLPRDGLPAPVQPVPPTLILPPPPEPPAPKPPAERYADLPRFGAEIFAPEKARYREPAPPEPTVPPGLIQGWMLLPETPPPGAPAAAARAQRLVPVWLDPRQTYPQVPGAPLATTPGAAPSTTPAGTPLLTWPAVPLWPAPSTWPAPSPGVTPPPGGPAASWPPPAAGYPLPATSPAHPAPGFLPSATWPPTAGQPVANMPVPPSYVVGPGDTLELRVWARSREQVAEKSTVSAEGFVILPHLGRLQVAGQTLGHLRETVQQAFRQFYTDPTVTLVIAEQRVVEVYVTGEATRPGKYTLTGMATVLTALYAAGGPSEIGSYRRILLTRIGEPALTVDLYDYLLHGRRDQDLLLQPGDTLFLPPLEAEVALEGEVRRPARYELLGAASVAEVLAMAGGLRSTAYAPRLELWRPDENREWKLLHLDCAGPSAPGLAASLQDGDLLHAPAMLTETRNTVIVEGAVRRPGVYSVEPGMTLSHLLRLAEDLSPEAHTQTGVLKRLNEDLDYEFIAFNVRDVLAGRTDLPLQRQDEVRILKKADVEPPLEVEVSGAVVRPDVYAWAEGMRVSDLLLQAGGPVPGAYMDYALLYRRTPDQTRELQRVALGAVANGQREANLLLQRGDLLEVLDRQQVLQPSTARIAGFVRKTGDYPRYEGMRISDLIIAAGGLQPGAGPNIEFTRGRFEGEPQPLRVQLLGTPESFTVDPDLLLADDDTVAVSGRGDFQQIVEYAFVLGQVMRPGSYAIKRSADRDYTVWDLLEETEGLLPEAYAPGMVLYRVSARMFTDVQSSDLEQIFRAINREATGSPQALTIRDREAALGTAVTQQISQVLSTETGVAIVLPPSHLGVQDRVAAIPVDGDLLIRTQGREGNLELQPYDTLVIPRRSSTVTILGAVARPGAVRYEQGLKVEDYLTEAGSTREDADRRRMIVVRANGSVAPARTNQELHPGDVLVVPSTYVVRQVRSESAVERWLKSIVSLAIAALVF